MKKILFIFLAACFFFSCEKEAIVIPQQHAGRTVLAFFWANNNLSDNLRRNILTMMNGLTEVTDSATLLVYWDGTRTARNPIGRRLLSCAIPPMDEEASMAILRMK